MARAAKPSPRSLRISVDVDASFFERVRLAAAEREMTIREYVATAIEDSLGRQEGGSSSALTAATDPVLADLWNNPQDAAYDRL